MDRAIILYLSEIEDGGIAYSCVRNWLRLLGQETEMKQVGKRQHKTGWYKSDDGKILSVFTIYDIMKDYHFLDIKDVGKAILLACSEQLVRLGEDTNSLLDVKAHSKLYYVTNPWEPRKNGK